MSQEKSSLRYTQDSEPGLARRDGRKGFEYFDARGRRVKQPQLLQRIKSLAIPPAWTDVWICADADGHLQATGRDARGRKQYRYHPRWRELRDQRVGQRGFDAPRRLFGRTRRQPASTGAASMPSPMSTSC